MIAREVWSTAGKYLELNESGEIEERYKISETVNVYPSQPVLWEPNQLDILAEDWEII